MHPLKSRTAPPLELKCTPSDLELHPLKIVSIKVRVLCHKNPTNLVGFFVATEEGFSCNKIRGPRGILCTRGEKEHTSKRVSIIAPDNVISKTKCATCARGFAAVPPATSLNELFFPQKKPPFRAVLVLFRHNIICAFFDLKKSDVA